MIQIFESFLYVISTALLYPVVIGLTLLTFWVILYLGRFVGDCIARKKQTTPYQGLFAGETQLRFERNIMSSTYPDIEIVDLIHRWKETQIKQINRIRFVVRLGPSLGLMGTLIPMGTALASLSQGDMLAMSSNMVTAFTTTIVGLGCGTVAFLIVLVKETWLRKDLHACEIYGETLLRNKQLDTAMDKKKVA